MFFYDIKTTDVRGAIAWAKAQPTAYLPLLGEQLERFVNGEEVIPIPVDMAEVYMEIDGVIRGAQVMTEVERNERRAVFRTTLTDGQVWIAKYYMRLAAEYVAFTPKATQ